MICFTLGPSELWYMHVCFLCSVIPYRVSIVHVT